MLVLFSGFVVVIWKRLRLKTVLRLDSKASMVQLQVYSFGVLKTCMLLDFHCTGDYGIQEVQCVMAMVFSSL